MKLACCWLYAISKYGYPPSMPDTFSAIREMSDLGFVAIELEGVGRENLLEVAGRRADIKAFCDDIGLRVVNFCPVLPEIVSQDASLRRAALELFKIAVDVAIYLGCNTVQTDSFAAPVEFVGARPYGDAIRYGEEYRVRVAPDFRWDGVWNALVDSIGDCARIVEGTGLRLLVEPRVGELVSNTDAMLRLMDAVKSEILGSVLDTAHLHAQKEILSLSVEKLGRRVLYVHASDNDGRINEHLAPGRGTVDWESVLLALRKHGFDGYVGLDVGGVPQLEAQVREGMVYLRTVAGQIGVNLA